MPSKSWPTAESSSVRLPPKNDPTDRPTEAEKSKEGQGARPVGGTEPVCPLANLCEARATPALGSPEW